MASSPIIFAAKLDDLEENTLLEALSHFNLSELAEIRRVSRGLRSACDRRKRHIHSLLKEDASVEITGLTSERGRQINGRLAVVDGAIRDGRYPVRMRHLTGETERVSLKPQNINPFIGPNRQARERSRLDFINYSSDGKVREGHGRLFDQILCLLRYGVNVTHGMSYFQGEYEDFCTLPRADQRVAMANVQVFTMYRVKPSSAGYKVPGDMSVLDSTIHSLSQFEDKAIDLFGKMANYDKDGSGGRLIVRNMVRFMQSWDTERIHGQFWICKIVKTGTLVVQRNDEHGRPELGNVYMVKGVGSVVGSQVPSSSLPLLVRTTFLPLYDMLVYDQIMLADERVPTTQSLKGKIERHVAAAVREGSVIHCGESAARGIWEADPPAVPTPVPGDGRAPKMPPGGDRGVIPPGPTPVLPTRGQLRAAGRIVELARDRGFRANKAPGPPFMVARRMGYTREDNPTQLVGLMYDNDGGGRGGIDVFRFKDWPTYTLDELLPEMVRKLERICGMPGLIFVDEKSLVEPLRHLLQAASEAVGFHEKMEVEWYPPPSVEEQAYHQQYGF